MYPRKKICQYYSIALLCWKFGFVAKILIVNFGGAILFRGRQAPPEIFLNGS